MLRVECTVEDQPTYDPFASASAEENIGFGLGTFDTGGKPSSIAPRLLPGGQRHSGWTYFVLAPGTYYLAVCPPKGMQNASAQSLVEAAPLWRMDIPRDASAVYLGSLQLNGGTTRTLFGRPILRWIDQRSIHDERELADKLLAEVFPELGPLHVALMRRHEGGPIILHSPLPVASE